ncbi:Uncharacterized protein BP5553_04640 [Venustampulla echinocandica]|uniref:Alpha/beta hydrolase fold-3 domain-containing protein n=1 Tax=Venustampulla echinocandica TaxID=2656787 RepID=A0A370TNV6_9HELO|nr:Uncharacterized protein BP5553_04640 [Venustampulla echinocandica]RDL37207.1 Uncharacterized protein BP5553_04640 [Venustampulla echinocandica]
MDSPKYVNFDISEVAYKVVNKTNISAFVLVPKGISEGKYPIIAKFHGGFFVTGASLYPDWFPDWALDYAFKQSAIIVCADYRLIPESTGLDILEDLKDFWAWARGGGLERHLSQVKAGINADLTKVIAYGESAGGSLAIQSGFILPHGFIKAIIATYPFIDIGRKRTVSIMGAPTIPPVVLDGFLAAIEPGKIVTSANPPERMPIVLSIAQQDRFAEFYGADEKLALRKVLETVDDMPHLLIIHGKEDSAVPVEGSVEFADAVRGKFGAGKIDLRVEPGEHGFDGSATLEMPWLKDGLSRVTELWLN